MRDKGIKRLVNAIIAEAARDALRKPTKSNPYIRDKAFAFLKSDWGELLLAHSCIGGYTSNQLIRRLKELAK